MITSHAIQEIENTERQRQLDNLRHALASGRLNSEQNARALAEYEQLACQEALEIEEYFRGQRRSVN